MAAKVSSRPHEVPRPQLGCSMSGMSELFWWLVLATATLLYSLAWVGHACIWTALLDRIYGCPLPKLFLKVWRYATGIVILAFPLLFLACDHLLAHLYFWPCVVAGGIVFPTVTVSRLRRKTPTCVISETTRTLDLWPDLGEKLIGDGKLAFAARLPGNGVFRVDFTDLTLAIPNLPAEWDGLSILVLNDLHFHGTPSRVYFDRVIDELASGSTPDLVCLLGDFVDTKEHREWIQPLLGRLSATEGRFAILGNHDRHYEPELIRKELTATGYAVLGNGWREVTIRGVRCVVIGHEGPWYRPAPDLSAAPPVLFRLCLSHTPDNFYWGIANRIGLMLCGHVHGGAIRVPVIGSIFVPSIYGRRFDEGVFEKDGIVMSVNRGLSGREPIRFRCNPQVLRVTLRVSRESTAKAS